MKRLRSTIGGVTLACAAISACGGDSSTTSQTIGKGCATDRDCNAGELCDRDALVCVLESPDGGPGAGGSGAAAGGGGVAGSGAAAGGGGVAGSGAAAGGGGIAGSGAAAGGGAAGASTGGSGTGGSAGTGTGACGDGSVDRPAEECDDGNTSTGDGCDGACRVETPPACGDGSLDFSTGEECDDGATASGDGCSATCQLETVGASCGDAQVDPNETCDDGNTTNGDACNPTCNLANNVTTFFTQVNGNESTIAVDQDDIWLADSGDCATGTTPGNLRRIPIAGGNATTITALPGCAAAGIATDGLGTVWVATGDIATGNAVIVEIDTTAVSPTANIVAGNNPCAAGVYTDDSAGNTACFSGIRGLTWWAGQLYIVDPAAGVIRRLDPSTNQVFNVAGDPFNNGYQDGTGTGARFDSPRYIVSDGSANLYVSETNIGAIRVVNAVTGAVSTLAGNGVPGYQDGIGTAGRMHRPRGLTSDGTSIYFVEFNAHAVRQIELATGALTTLAGNVTTCASAANCTGGDVCANGVCLPASSGPPVGGGFIDGVGTAAEFFAPFSIAWHFPSRSLFVVDTVNSAIRRIQ